jgi:hypothetical protein
MNTQPDNDMMSAAVMREAGRRRIGAFQSPFLSMVPSCVVETLVTLSAAKATIPFRRLPVLHDLARLPAQEKSDETQAHKQGWCCSESGMY